MFYVFLEYSDLDKLNTLRNDLNFLLSLPC